MCPVDVWAAGERGGWVKDTSRAIQRNAWSNAGSEFPLGQERIAALSADDISASHRPDFARMQAEIQKLKSAESEVLVDLFVRYVTTSFSSVLTCGWLDRRSRLTPVQIDDVFRSLVLPTVERCA